jgi:hypothetical protein
MRSMSGVPDLSVALSFVISPTLFPRIDAGTSARKTSMPGITAAAAFPAGAGSETEARAQELSRKIAKAAGADFMILQSGWS